MFVVIAGCGRMGRHIAETLFESGVDVMVIDKSAQALNQLRESFGGFTLHADVTEMETLKSAGMDRADVFLACTGKDDINHLTAQIARNIFDVSEVIVRTVDPLRIDFFKKMGFEVVCPVLLGAEATLDKISDTQSA